MINTEVVSPLPFAKGFWLINEGSELLLLEQRKPRPRGRSDDEYVKRNGASEATKMRVETLVNKYRGEGITIKEVADTLCISNRHASTTMSELFLDGTFSRKKLKSGGRFGIFIYYMFDDKSIKKAVINITCENLIELLSKAGEIVSKREMRLRMKITSYDLNAAIKTLLDSKRIKMRQAGCAGKSKVYAYSIA